MTDRTRKQPGLYAKRCFEPDSQELARLKQQATLVRTLEHDIWQNAGLKPGMQVLDVGCGPGFTSCELARFIGAEGTVTGIDVNASLLRVADRVRTDEAVENVTFKHTDLYQEVLPENTYDFAYARFVFQHLPDPDLAIRRIRHSLKPGGVLCILDVDDRWISFSPASRACARFVSQTRRIQQRRGVNRLIGSQLNGHLQRGGFVDAKTRIIPLTTTDIGLQAFLAVALLFRIEWLNGWQRLLVGPGLRAIQKAAQEPLAWGAIGIFCASGRTPVRSS